MGVITLSGSWKYCCSAILHMQTFLNSSYDKSNCVIKISTLKHSQNGDAVLKDLLVESGTVASGSVSAVLARWSSLQSSHANS